MTGPILYSAELDLPEADIPAFSAWYGGRHAPDLYQAGFTVCTCYRAVEGGSIALALLANGAARHGEELIALSPTRGQQATVRVTSPHFYDPAGERYRD